MAEEQGLVSFTFFYKKHARDSYFGWVVVVVVAGAVVAVAAAGSGASGFGFEILFWLFVFIYESLSSSFYFSGLGTFCIFFL